MESVALLNKYLTKYISRMPGESFGDVFLQYASDDFEGKVTVNTMEELVTNREQYAEFLDSCTFHRFPFHQKLSQEYDIITGSPINLMVEFTSLKSEEKDNIAGYVIVGIHQQYSIVDNKISSIVERQTDYLYLDNLTHLEYVDKYLQIPFKDITLKWHSNYHDGMLSGVAEYRNELVWFECCDDLMTDYLRSDNIDIDYEIPGFNFYRRFLIYELSDEDVKELTYWHDLFCKHVGEHTNYVNNERSSSRCLPYDTHKLFYEPYKHAEKRDYCKGTPIGWFEQK